MLNSDNHLSVCMQYNLARLSIHQAQLGHLASRYPSDIDELPLNRPRVFRVTTCLILSRTLSDAVPDKVERTYNISIIRG